MQSAVVIPIYNEAATIRELAIEVLKHTDALIIVDDGSEDDSRMQLDGLAIILLSNPQNMGKGFSLQRGLQHALSLGARSVITLDGDAQHDPHEIPNLLQAALAHPDRIIIAARLKQRENAPKLRLFANQFADFWVSWAAGYPVQDSQSGFRLYPSRALEAVRIQVNRERGFVFESEFLIEAAQHRIYSISVPVESIYREGGRVSHYKPWTDTWRIVRMIAGRLIRRRLYLRGLFQAIHLMPDPRKAD
ncbi:MAG: glycosyltransferase family 2 protein [Gammaproteobacteria bacterium]|nr:glycosyltransferase family 2 protein [Gammaproteobacteria bacterium]